MADKLSSSTSAESRGAAESTLAAPPKRIAKGVVLDKDGKPCRPCTSFAAWASQTSSSLKATTAETASAVSATPRECPADVEMLGRSAWTLLHSIAATYPTLPTTTEQSDVKGFMRLFAKLYPCWVCAEDFQQYIQKQEIRAGSRDEFGNWLCEAHNEVNKKLGKPSLKKPVAVAEYLFTRLHQIGIRSVHGLPGDFNLTALDYIPKAKLRWVGSVNELNAAYAADGYARSKGISALATTFGVGELSAMNGVAGAYSEHIPMVHIVGCPSTISQRNGMLLHHTLGNGDFNVFANMSSQISCDVARLTKPAEIAEQIDHALRECWIRSRPVYIMLPTDMAEKQVEGRRLDTAIDLSEPKNDVEREDYVVEAVRGLVSKTRLPVFVTPMGKGAVDENSPSYGGVYAGCGSSPDVIAQVEGSDLVLFVGSLKSDFNTTGFSYHTSQLTTIDFHSTHCAVRYSEYPGVTMRGVLRKITEGVDPTRLSPPDMPRVVNEVAKNRDNSQTITQAWFWPRLGMYLKEGDIVVTETGTANFGIWETRFPAGVTGINQILWGSLGWSVGAAQGAALGARDMNLNCRTILLVGDGSFQLTVQEVSTMIRHGLNITMQRCIHDMDAEYNNIVPWKYTEIPGVFGATDKQVKKYVVETKDEVDRLLTNKDFTNGLGLQFVELEMARDDAPRALKLAAEIAARNNTKAD
ncbi:thiamine diphosphate-binding protein [Lasiosphaeria miniovina]|uniref:Sulfhydryl oxidase n=1 Tax=Lasiosphaeria miniovina TaxID=1954250 RepID=A0AA40ADD4_9PEZI|nr:thiamine diphosphate-binding protein [Lasiosphaeria miniovina]KAK0713832.1 thiamine diphosphate-binding protein [Lasiosphaeria miniovina]